MPHVDHKDLSEGGGFGNGKKQTTKKKDPVCGGGSKINKQHCLIASPHQGSFILAGSVSGQPVRHPPCSRRSIAVCLGSAGLYSWGFVELHRSPAEQWALKVDKAPLVGWEAPSAEAHGGKNAAFRISHLLPTQIPKIWSVGTFLQL